MAGFGEVAGEGGQEERVWEEGVCCSRRDGEEGEV